MMVLIMILFICFVEVQLYLSLPYSVGFHDLEAYILFIMH